MIFVDEIAATTWRRDGSRNKNKTLITSKNMGGKNLPSDQYRIRDASTSEVKIAG